MFVFRGSAMNMFCISSATEKKYNGSASENIFSVALAYNGIAIKTFLRHLLLSVFFTTLDLCIFSEALLLQGSIQIYIVPSLRKRNKIFSLSTFKWWLSGTNWYFNTAKYHFCGMGIPEWSLVAQVSPRYISSFIFLI